MRFPRTEDEKQDIVDEYTRIPMRLLRMHRDNGKMEYHQCGQCANLNEPMTRVFKCALFDKAYGENTLYWRKKWTACGAFKGKE